jgi:hypothetical protein
VGYRKGRDPFNEPRRFVSPAMAGEALLVIKIPSEKARWGRQNSTVGVGSHANSSREIRRVGRCRGWCDDDDVDAEEDVEGDGATMDSRRMGQSSGWWGAATMDSRLVGITKNGSAKRIDSRRVGRQRGLESMSYNDDDDDDDVGPTEDDSDEELLMAGRSSSQSNRSSSISSSSSSHCAASC